MQINEEWKSEKNSRKEGAKAHSISASRSHSVSFGVVWNQLIDISKNISSNLVPCVIFILDDYKIEIRIEPIPNIYFFDEI